MRSHTLAITRFADHEVKYPQLKDPSIVILPDGRYAMYATLGGSKEPLSVGRFIAEQPAGPWRELSPVRFHNLTGPELCAPAVRLKYDGRRNTHLWEMYIQTSCFRKDGIIALATSEDGCNFFGHPAPVITRNSLEKGHAPLVGLYDAGISRITVAGKPADCLLYTGYSAIGDNPEDRLIGVGDLYMSLRFAEGDGAWTPGRQILSHKDVPFHNQLGYRNYEWGLEGAKLLQLAENQYLLAGVCFLEKSDEFVGHRQRVFLAAASSPFDSFVPVGEPIEPGGSGETGHPDALITGNKLTIVHQERLGNDSPWHLRHREYELEHVRSMVSDTLDQRECAGVQAEPECQHDFGAGSASFDAQPYS